MDPRGAIPPTRSRRSVATRRATGHVGFLVDVGLDGVDEVVFESSYYEGSFQHLLSWDGNEPRLETLASDGA